MVGEDVDQQPYAGWRWNGDRGMGTEEWGQGNGDRGMGTVVEQQPSAGS
jgi:hypothetical protein